jgi:ribose transport system substrate-binding protein
MFEVIPLFRIAVFLTTGLLASCIPSASSASADTPGSPAPSVSPLASVSPAASPPSSNSASAPSSDTPSGTASAKVELQLAFVANSASDFWVLARKGCEQARTEVANVNVDFRVASEATAAEQKRIVDDLLAKGIDGLAISPVDPVFQTYFINETEKKTLVFTQDNDAPESDRVCYIGTDNHDAGMRAGGLLKEALPDGGKVMIFVGKSDAQNATDRLNGLRDAIKGTKIEILDVLTDNTDPFLAKANAVFAMVNHTDLAALVGLWSYNGPAILNAVKDAQKVGKVKIVCFDNEIETLAGVKQGAIFGTIIQQPFEFGRLAIVSMASYLRGDKSVVPESKQIIVPTLVIRRENVDEYIERIHQLRGSQP